MNYCLSSNHTYLSSSPGPCGTPSDINALGQPLGITGHGDALLLVLFVATLAGLTFAYNKEKDRLFRIRFASMMGLFSVIFLCVSPSVPWLQGATEAFMGETDAQIWSLVSDAVPIGVVFSLALIPLFIWTLVSPENGHVHSALCFFAGAALFCGICVLAMLWTTSTIEWTLAKDVTLLASGVISWSALAIAQLGLENDSIANLGSRMLSR